MAYLLSIRTLPLSFLTWIKELQLANEPIQYNTLLSLGFLFLIRRAAILRIIVLRRKQMI